MERYEARRRKLLTTGGALTALAVYLLMAFTAFSGRDLLTGVEGACAGAGDPGAIALSAVGEALRAGPGIPPAPAAAPGASLPACDLDAHLTVPVDAAGAARSPVEDRQVLTR